MSTLGVPTFRCPKCSREIPTVNEVIHSVQCRGAAGAASAAPHVPPAPPSRPVHEGSEIDGRPVSTSSPGEIPLIVIDSDEDDDDLHSHHHDDEGDFHDFDHDSDDDIEFIEMENNSWPCRACTLLNDAHATRCQLCNTSRLEEAPRSSRPSSSSSRRSPAASAVSAASYEPSHWMCGRCTYENPASMHRCEMCGDCPRVVPRVHYGMVDDRMDEADLFSPMVFGAGLGAGAAMLNGRSVVRGAAEGAGMGLLGGLLMNSMHEDLMRRHRTDDDSERMILHDMIMPRHFVGGFPVHDNAEPQGVSRDLLGQLPTRTFRSETDRPDQCSICLEHFKDREKVRTLPCLHQFHEKCVDPWLRGHNTCPVCKHQIR